MTEPVHVFFNPAASGCVRQAIRIETINVVRLDDDLSVGPIRDLTIPAGRSRRARWWARIHQEEPYDWRPNDWPALQNIQKKAAESKPFLCWVGPNAEEMLGFWRFLSVLPSGCNVSAVYLPEGWGAPYQPRSIGQCTPKMARQLFRHHKMRVSPMKQRQFIADWRVISRDAAMLRIRLSDGRIVPLSETLNDKALIRLGAKNRRIRQNKVISECFFTKGIPLNLLYLTWRVRTLRK